MEDNNNETSGSSWTPGTSSSLSSAEGKSDDTKVENQESSTQNSSNQKNQAQPHVEVNVSFSDSNPGSGVYATVFTEPKQYSQGCLGAAWSDMRKSGNWLSKSALMGLIEYIPILNWVNTGYALRWGRELIFGKIQDLPSSIFGERTFVNGAMAFLISFIVGIVSWILCAMFGVVPLFGILVGVCIALFLNVFNIAMNMRAAVFDSLGEGFSIGEIWGAIKDNFWKAFVIMLVPELICGLIGCAIALIIIITNGVIFGSDFILLAKNLSGYAGHLSTITDAQALQILLYIGKTFAVLIPGIILSVYFMNWLSMIATLLKYRAFGHFIARYAVNWRSEPNFMDVERREKDNISA